MGNVPGGVGAGGAGASMPAASQFADFGGVDPSLDPELAMALRISLEEERARQVHPDEPAQAQAPAQQVQPQPLAPVAQPDVVMNEGEEEEELDDEAILQRALMMSTAGGAEQVTLGGPLPNAQPAQDAQNQFSDLLENNEFLQDIAKDLGIDGLDMGDLKSEEQKKKEEEEKKK